MAWRIGNNVIKGMLDNRQKGLVTGNIWVAGCPEPIQLELQGNFLRDMAGAEVFFENPDPVAVDALPVDPLQIGMTGDMTASRKVTLVNPDAGTAHPGGLRKGNALYLEWFSESSGRVVIEAVNFKINLDRPSWVMTQEEETAQIASNRESFRAWLEHLSELEETEEIPSPAEAGRPLNEFEWERLLKDSDRKNERLGEVLEKYHGHPDSEKLIAREMGWTWVEEELEAQERGVFAEIDEESLPDAEDAEDEDPRDARDPDPVREGIDWVRDEDGSIEHPLAMKALSLSAKLWKDFEDSGLLGESGDSRIFEWVGLVESAGVRLSSTLGELAYGEDVEPGYLVAGLKRSVHLIHQSLDMLQQLEPLDLFSREYGRETQGALFQLREDVLEMMREYRFRAR